VRLDSLHDKLADLRTSQATVERTLTDLAALSESAATVTHAVASPLEIRAVVIEAPRTGELRDGVLPALRLSGEAGAISGEDESWRDIAWGVSRSGAGVVSSWLQNRAATGRMAQRTIRLSPGATVALDLWRLLPPRMVQARGSHVFELAPRPGWGGGLELRCPESGSGEIQIEFRTADGSGSGRAASSDWQRTTIPEGGTLIITGRRDAGAHPGAEAGGGPSPHEQAVGRSEFVVILSPRRPERVDETVPEPARLLPMIDAPELPASGE
jgi:hypothetical protein